MNSGLLSYLDCRRTFFARTQVGWLYLLKITTQGQNYD
ncbi:hypothetical protein SPLC1_S531890 [Arthrospira platensis C1]|nr:hypothetical protein SPLC1_S531890 [Arthrospira platensis C1]